ncbi:3997_t:CDS:2 [Paraglomus brasilianum]|uniref:3997_t:CDS:1 n=1 Tax=Paraglomus brasilianum TaxID=144538 RepID=A0A9N9GNI5_9GLOM|nr:3997_t:CDS:2 [Paraglomus brasilianum]
MLGHVPQSILSANPNFAELHKQIITRYLTPDGRTKALEETDVNDFTEEKMTYLEHLALYNELQKLAVQGFKPPKDGRTQGALSDVLAFAETRQLLRYRPRDPDLRSSGVTLLGLTEKDLYKQVEGQLGTVKNSKDIIIKAIEERLIKRCEDIAKLHYSGQEINPKLRLAKASQLDIVLKKKTSLIESTKIDQFNDYYRLGETLATYLEVTKDILETLWCLLEEFMLRHECEKNKGFNEYFSAIVNSIILKLRVLRINTLLSVYDKDTVESLKAIREKLRVEEISKQIKLREVEELLGKYETFGSEFEEIIKEYIALQKDILIAEDNLRRITG